MRRGARIMSEYSSLHDLLYDYWPLCNGGNPRARPEYVHSGNQEHEPVRMHNLLLGVFVCPVCGRKSDYSRFRRSHRKV